MDIDPDICNWIMEFLFRQPLEDRILNSLLRAVSLPKENPKLVKSLLLKKLESELSQHSVSESTLDLLEQLEEIESRQGNLPVSNAMKRAYCAVAVHCTLKPLVTRDDGDDDHDARKFRFFEAVKRLWRGRIGLMEKGVGRGGLGSDLLWEWKDDIEAAVWDDVVCKSIVKKFEGVDANEAIRDYVREEWEKMGPSFLELVAERVKNDDGFLKNLVAGNQDRVAGAGVDGSNATKEVNKARESLESSSSEPRAVVKDPLPQASQIAEAIEARQIDSNKLADDNHGKPNNAPKPSLMERNNTAHTEEWDDSPVFQLPSPKRIKTSPLKLYEFNDVMKKRRRGRRWSLEEEDALRAGVEKHGRGCWKAILMEYRQIFVDRTDVDLKDKWRNLTR